ncbi:hypothetical protein DM558_01130 [Entomomonas moraniae]|uniref:Uncharacterized protein n=1 Tax=Entomomonas moraniae TaxID=2213226 RepID=A0A3S9XAI5_9GAMM|nr:hypothetical protein [Entomomonas moraniae]AZS49462.1 hypothetical protein DM558_01130 [Entomomonas moraniae]
MLKKIIRLFVMALSLTVILIPTGYLTKDTLFKPILYWFFSKEAKAKVIKGCTMKPSNLRGIHTERCTDVEITFKVNNTIINATIDEYNSNQTVNQINIRYAIFAPSIVIADEPILFLFLFMLFLFLLELLAIAACLASIDEFVADKIKNL